MAPIVSCAFDVLRPLRRLSLLTFVLSVVTLCGLTATAQETGASIVGQVKDESGGVLPGVTVKATSPALQVPQLISVTDMLRGYRLTAVAIWQYYVACALRGL